MAISLIEHKRITTTVAKAKALRRFIEPLVTKAKNCDPNNKESYTHARRVIFSYLQNKEAIKELFDEVIEKVGDRPGGYTRILRIGNRAGDNAEMAFIEFVDFNEYAPGKVSEGGGSRRSRRRRRGKKSGSGASEQTETKQQQTAAESEDLKTTAAAIEEAEVVESPVEQPEAAVEDAPVAEAEETSTPEETSAPEETPETPTADAEDNQDESTDEDKKDA
jgi:large subunit ribosomal protein L17